MYQLILAEVKNHIGYITINRPNQLNALNKDTIAELHTALDSFNQDGGSLNSWSINLCNTQPLSTSENTLQDFVLFPNPNKGNFTVQFNSTSNNEIKINVYDISGRRVFENNFENTGLFSQNIQLNNLQSGVYIVNVQDGNTKEVKRIIIE